MIEHLDLLDNVLSHGVPRRGEKPAGEGDTLTVWGAQVKFNLREGFPLQTVRDFTWSWKNIITREAPWMLSGSTNAVEADEKFGLKLWRRWAEDSEKKLGTPPGELGPIYGHQFRNWNGRTDQLKIVVDMLRKTHQTRRGVISLWNIDDVEWEGKKVVNVADCISMLHVSINPHLVGEGVNGKPIYKDFLDGAMTHRSCDLAAGAPHDWPVFSLILMGIARELGLEAGTLVSTIEDGQVYLNQISAVRRMLEREPYPRPTVTIKKSAGTIYEARPGDYELHNYQHHEKIRMPTTT